MSVLIMVLLFIIPLVGGFILGVDYKQEELLKVINSDLNRHNNTDIVMYLVDLKNKIKD